MDASAYIETDKWELMKTSNGWNEIEMRDNRYNQIVHMVSAANGAEEFYSTEVSFATEKTFVVKLNIFKYSRNTHVAQKALTMLVSWTIKQLPPGSAIRISTLSITRRNSKRKWIAWSSVSARSSASTPVTACCALRGNSSSSFLVRFATICSRLSRTSTLFITICNQVDYVCRLACESAARTDIGGKKNLIYLTVDMQ